MKSIIHVLIIVLLTLLTQIGGIIYLIVVLSIGERQKRRDIKRIALFLTLYVFSVFMIVPIMAKLFGRQQIEDNSHLQAHSLFYKLTNRTYVTPELNEVLVQLSEDVKQIDNDLKVIYLDANFPFFEGFPLLPHLSHNDGEKVDITLIYEDKYGKSQTKRNQFQAMVFTKNQKQTK